MAELDADDGSGALDAGALSREGPGAAWPASAALVPDWLVNLAELAWRVLAVAGLVVVLWFIGTTLWTVTASIAVAVVISAVFAPYVLRLRSRGRTRTAAAGIVWVAAIAVVAGALLLLALAFLPYVVELLSRIDTGVADLQARLLDLQVPAFVPEMVSDAVEVAGDSAGDIVASAANAVTVMILASFLVFFFLRDGDRAWVWAFQAVSDQKRERITEAGHDALLRVGGYLRGTTVLAGVIAITDYVFMLVLGVPLAMPLAVLAFFSGYVPYFGGIVTTILILLVTLGSLGPGPALVLLVLIGIRNVILGYGVRPAVYGRTVSVHPALVLMVLPAGFALGGIVGLFAAVPVTAVVLAVATAVVAIVDPIPHPPLPGLVPAWLDRVAQFSWRVLVALAAIALLFAIFATVPLVLIPVVLAVILAATLEPLVLALVRRGWSRARAAGIAVGGGFLVIVGVLLLSVAVLVQEAASIAETTASGAESASASLGGQLALPASAVAGAGREIVSAVAAMADGAVTLAVITLLATLLTFYFIRDGGRLWARLTVRIRPEVSPEISAAARRAFDVLGGYMFGTAVISFVGAASQLVIMLVLGLPLALPVFVLSFFLNFIPYIGGFISTGVAFLIAIAVGSPMDVVIMGIWTIAFNLVTGNIVSPIVYGRTVHIHPAIVLVAIPAAATIAGMLGMFIVVPVLGVVAATWRTVLAVMGSHVEPDAARTAPPPGPEVTADVPTPAPGAT